MKQSRRKKRNNICFLNPAADKLQTDKEQRGVGHVITKQRDKRWVHGRVCETQKDSNDLIVTSGTPH